MTGSTYSPIRGHFPSHMASRKLRDMFNGCDPISFSFFSEDVKFLIAYSNLLHYRIPLSDSHMFDMGDTMSANIQWRGFSNVGCVQYKVNLLLRFSEQYIRQAKTKERYKGSGRSMNTKNRNQSNIHKEYEFGQTPSLNHPRTLCPIALKCESLSM